MGLGQSHEKWHILQGFIHRDRHSLTPHSPEGEVEAQAWYGVGRGGFVFPEVRDGEDGVPHLREKDSLAICLSGGSMRACVCSLGYVRALRMLGVLGRARYINANSGSAWFTAPLSYQEKVPTDLFLGEHVPPEELSLEKAGHLQEGSFGRTVADGNFMIGKLARDLMIDNVLLDLWLPKDQEIPFRAWEDAVGNTFLESYGLADANAAFGLHGRTQLAEAAGAPQIHTACRDHDMPYPVLTACAVDAGRVPEKCPFVSFEFTPLYSGVPVHLDDAERKWGGLLLETFAGSSHPPMESKRDADEKASVRLKVEWMPPLPQAVGISSQFLAMIVDAQRSGLWDSLGCPELFYFNGLDHSGCKAELTDGGGSDNCAIYPALRRGIRKLVVCTAMAVEVCDDWAEQEFDISGYFGAYPEGKSFKYSKLEVTAEAWNRSAQVFERAAWDGIFGELRQKMAEGQPQVIRKRLQVLPNPEQGIEGGYEVDTVWVFNGRPAEWWKRLPESSKAYLDEKVPTFPRVNTYVVDWEPETVSFVSNICAWQILQAQDLIRDFMSSPDSAGGKSGCCSD